MTKEELEKEAEEYVSKYQGWGWTPHKGSAVYYAMLNSYIDSAEPREKRIEELEKENAELKEDNDARKFAMAMSERVEKQLRKENAELKKENQKWKDGIALKDEEIGCIETDFNTFKSKAKELLKQWVELYRPKLEGYSITPIQEQTEQFLSEVEK